MQVLNFVLINNSLQVLSKATIDPWQLRSTAAHRLRVLLNAINTVILLQLSVEEFAEGPVIFSGKRRSYSVCNLPRCREHNRCPGLAHCERTTYQIRCGFVWLGLLERVKLPRQRSRSINM